MTQAPLPDSTVPPPQAGDGSIFGPVQLTRTMIVVVGILFAIAFYYVARWLPWPDEPGFRGSMGQAKAIGAFVVAIVLLIICTLLGTALLGRRWFLAGLMTATAGLTTWSVRGGTMPFVLFHAQNAGSNQTVFLQMVGELIVFFGVIAALWSLIWKSASIMPALKVRETESAKAASWKMSRNTWVKLFGVTGYVWVERVQKTRATAQSSPDDEGRSTGAGLLAQTAIMAVLMMILVVTPMKKQVLTAVFLSGVISTAIAEFFFADRRAGRWYWVAPLVVGAFGYLAAYFSSAGMETGDLQGMFAPLARVLPLDYASMGIAGVLFGYWWMEPDAQIATEAGDADAATANTPTTS